MKIQDQYTAFCLVITPGIYSYRFGIYFTRDCEWNIMNAPSNFSRFTDTEIFTDMAFWIFDNASDKCFDAAFETAERVSGSPFRVRLFCFSNLIIVRTKPLFLAALFVARNRTGFVRK